MRDAGCGMRDVSTLRRGVLCAQARFAGIGSSKGSDPLIALQIAA
jgi:hypothetical protein